MVAAAKLILVCNCCGGPRSKYSAAWCRNCYRKDSRPTQFKPVSLGIDWSQLDIVLAETQARYERDERRNALRQQVEANLRIRLQHRIQAYQDSLTRRRMRSEEAVAKRHERVVQLEQYRAERLALRTQVIAARALAKARNSAPTLASMSYPYVSVVTKEHSDLMLVNTIVPRGMEGREDVCQEIMIALWERRFSIDDLRANKKSIQEFITAFRRNNFESGGYAVSLDAPRADGRSWHDIIVDPQRLPFS